MDEARVLVTDEASAHAAAAALDASAIPARVARADELLGITGASGVGRFAVLVPTIHATDARRVLDLPPARAPSRDGRVAWLLLAIAGGVVLVAVMEFVVARR